jgi:nicotinate-nucleotide--dimethylbenzimidazole phosphoribosyltransferase
MKTEQELRQFIEKITPVSHELDENVQKKLDNLTKPLGSLGFLEDSVKKLARIQKTISPKIEKKKVYTFAGDHGIAQESVSAYPATVTPQMVLNFLNGGAAINVLANQFNIEMKVVDMGVNYEFGAIPNLIQKKIENGTKNFLHEPAMTREQALQSLLVGIELAQKAKEENVQLLIAGDMGIGNTTTSSAITAILCDQHVEEVTGIGTGVSDDGLKHKIEILKQALENRKPNKQDPLDILTKVGGFELGAIAGLALGCAYHKIPLISDGFISTTGVTLGNSLCSVVKDVLFPVECTSEIGNKHLLDLLNLPASLSLNVRLGEGTGAALLIPMLEAALNLYNNMATFESAGVDNRE